MLELIRRKYADYGPVLLAETLAEREGLHVARETVRRWLREAGLRAAGRRRWRRHVRRERRARFGELVQLDASIHRWLEGRGRGGREPVLISIVDDATGRSFGRFHAGETVHAIQDVMRPWIERHTRPRAWYVDRASQFQGKRDEDGFDPRYNTQIGRMWRELDSELLLARSPQAKGRVERALRTHRDRLVNKLRERGIRTIEQGNAFVEQQYWPEHNRRFARPAAEPRDAHRPLTLEQAARLEEIFSVREQRTLGKGEVVKLDGRVLQLEGAGRCRPRPGCRIEVLRDPHGGVRLRYEGLELGYRDVTEAHLQSAAERREAKELTRRRRRLEAALRAQGVTHCPRGRPLEQLTSLELQALRAPVPPRADHPWRRRALDKPPRRAG
ncbi:MAG: hypothetical protein KatS3mg102_0553 [Planctomycetota bacterium]|nr:MAG: hypothetical protein KatS3mg102_0553 [Planctomycetota bacterium]